MADEKFFECLGFDVEEKDVNAILEKRVDKVKVSMIKKIVRERQIGRKSTMSDKDFYAFKNQDLQTSLAISDIIDKLFYVDAIHCFKIRDSFIKGRVLDIGCGVGILTCYIAQSHPECEVVGIDSCKEAIENCFALAEMLNLKNVTFRHIEASELDEQFDTVLSTKTLHENYDRKVKFNIEKPLYREGEFFKNLFLPYASTISKLLKEDGVFLSFERTDYNGFILGWLWALEENNVEVIADKTYRFMTKENDQESMYFSFVSKKVSTINQELTVYDKYNKTFAMFENLFEDEYVGEYAALFFQNSVRGTMDAFKVKDENGQCIFHMGIYYNDCQDSLLRYSVYYDEAKRVTCKLTNIGIESSQEIKLEVKHARDMIKPKEYKVEPFAFSENDFIFPFSKKWRRLIRIKPQSAALVAVKMKDCLDGVYF